MLHSVTEVKEDNARNAKSSKVQLHGMFWTCNVNYMVYKIWDVGHYPLCDIADTHDASAVGSLR